MLHLVDTTGVVASIIRAIRIVQTDVKLQVSEDGIMIRAFDNSGTQAVYTTIPSTAFETYQCTESIVCVDLSHVASAITPIGTGVPVTIIYTESSKMLRILGGNFEFASPVLDVNAINKTPNLPSIAYPASVDIPGQVLDTAVRASLPRFPIVQFGTVVDNDTQMFEVVARDGASFMRAAYPSGDNGVTVTAETSVSSRFSGGIVASITGILSRCAVVSVKVGQDIPVLFSGNLTSDINVSYAAAPRIG
jgi:hypothetical protein